MAIIDKIKAKAKAEALGPDGLSLKSVGSPESTPRSQAGHTPAPKLAELPPTPLRYVLCVCPPRPPRPAPPCQVRGPPWSQGRSEHLRGRGFGPGPSCPSPP